MPGSSARRSEAEPGDPADGQRRLPARLLPVGLGAASGLLLFASDHPIGAWPLCTVALLPLLAGLAGRPRLRWAALAGLALGVVYTGALSLVLEFPFLFAAAQSALLSGLWALAAALAALALRAGGVRGAFGAAGAVAAVEWASFALVPIWGTAQCFARVLSAAPRPIGFVSWTGMAGLVLVVVAFQALLVALVRERSRGLAVALAGVIALPLGFALRPDAPARTLRVAALGWSDADLAQAGVASNRDLFDRIAEPLIRDAAARGARVVALPEVSFRLQPDERERILGALGALAGEHGLLIAAGYFDVGRGDNRIAFLGPSGPLGEYRKTHLVPTLETYTPGDGTLVIVEHAGARIGGIICQDDNFTDLARALGRAGVELVVVPTNDWRQVQPYHYENSRFRPIENHYALVRAASDGTSAIVSPRGDVLASRDPFRERAGLVVADVPLGGGGTLYARAGDWVAALAALLLGAAIRRGARA